MNLRLLRKDDIFAGTPTWREHGGSNYLAMYSSVFGGVVTDPALMVMPIDDHVINRGDGIFEYFPVAKGHAYCFQSHMARLKKSAELISLDLPFDIGTIAQIILGTIAMSGARDCGVRLFVSRGMGDFSCSPTTPRNSLLYVIVMTNTAEDGFPARMFTDGATAITAHVPMKPGFYAQVKSTDYLLNALVALEAHRNDADFGVWFDDQDCLAESSTENVAVVDRDGVFKYPPFLHTLRGTGLVRGVELASQLVSSGDLKAIGQTDVTRDEVFGSPEVFLLSSGTVLPIVTFDGKTIGSGKPGPIFHRLNELFKRDMLEGPAEVRTPIAYR